MSFTVEIDIKDVLDWVEVLADRDKIIDLEKKNIGDLAVEIMQSFAPVKTGQFRVSITAEIIGDSVYVGPKIWYAPYVLNPTVRSPGRYIPTLDRRLVTPLRKIGFHPGTPGNPLITKTFGPLVDRLDEFIIDYLRRIMGD